MKDNPALPGGSLKSKPTWESNSMLSHVGFFCTFGNAPGAQHRKSRRIGKIARGSSPAIIIERRPWTPTEADEPKTEAEKPGTPSTGKFDLPDGWASSGLIAT